ncbi:Histidine protein methyltransferase 1 [Fasciola gigantica]|uniref:protein-histidine N-methyltransferase n=1 Tax=Fasciola gigantica TaxID=46835 RepID=A0A504YBG9_FASGI|nr:Histidine protein methyltransferase 1 [Fasciola gigantica]
MLGENEEEIDINANWYYTTEIKRFTLADGNRDTQSLPTMIIPLGLGPIPALKLVSENALEHFLREKANENGNSNPVLASLGSGKDIVPGVVEGGFTVWNGSRQMVEFLIDKGLLEGLHSKRILELGCGAGIPGLAALKVGAASVTFQDYNPEVLVYWTIPNVSLNAVGPELGRANFVSGDWAQLAVEWESERPSERYDVILTAETIYRTDLYSRLHRACDACLAPDGEVLVFCKITYGPGGTLWDFLEFVNTQQRFRTIVNQVAYDGVQTFLIQMKRISRSVC